MKLAKVVEGMVVKMLKSVPENLEDTSNFVALSAEEMRQKGWYPVREVMPALGPYEFYGAPTVEVFPTEVVHTYPVITASLSDVKQAQRGAFREQLKAKLYENYDVDDYVALIVLQIVPAALKTRVQNLKAAYDDAISALNATTTVSQAAAITPTWPA